MSTRLHGFVTPDSGGKLRAVTKSAFTKFQKMHVRIMPFDVIATGLAFPSAVRA